MIIYEYPLNEHIRTLLKLERLFQQSLRLIQLDDVLLQQAALFHLFELFEITARNEIRTDLQMELTRQQQLANAALTNAHALNHATHALHNLPGRLDQALRDQEWLSMLKQRANIPGGVNSFDVPWFYHWQHLPAKQRRADLVNWISPMLPIYQALSLVLKSLREHSSPVVCVARQGFHQQMLNDKNTRLLRIGIPRTAEWIPEISASRHAITIRFVSTLPAESQDAITPDIEFQLCLCQT